MDDRVYCCQANADEPMLGTADLVDVWLLVEHRQAWRAKAWTENALADGTRQWLADGVAALAAQGLKVRPQMIRQPEEAKAGFRLLVHQEGKLRSFYSQCANYEDLAATPLDALVAGDGGERLQAPQYFVCVNGQRDRCCARFGLPLYRRLRTLVGERAWQITHLGGHRFAPNVLVLPQGVLYGRVHPGKPDGGESLQPGSARGNPSHEGTQPGSARGNPSHEGMKELSRGARETTPRARTRQRISSRQWNRARCPWPICVAGVVIRKLCKPRRASPASMGWTL